MWIIFGLIAAFSDASKNVLAKHNTRTVNSAVIAWGVTLWSLIILVPALYFDHHVLLTTQFWFVVLIEVFFYFTSMWLYIEALKQSDLSLALPMLAVNPVIILFTSWVINHEFPRPLGVAGVFAVICGTYLLHFKSKQKNIWAPFLELTRHKGSVMMLGVAAIWGVSGSLDKYAVLHSSPLFYSAIEAVIMAVLFTPVAFLSSKPDAVKIFKKPYLWQMITLGVLDGVMTISQMIGQSLTYSVYIISIKRTSIIFSSVLAYFLFKEKIRDRILPIAFMVAGVIMIALS